MKVVRLIMGLFLVCSFSLLNAQNNGNNNGKGNAQNNGQSNGRQTSQTTSATDGQVLTRVNGGANWSNLNINGSVVYAVDNFTATSTNNSYDMDETNYLLLANTSNVTAEINLPAANTCEGMVYHVIKTSTLNSLLFSENITTEPSTTRNSFSGTNVQVRIISAGGQLRILEVRY